MKRENDIIYMKAVPRELPPLPEGKRLVSAAAYSLPPSAPAQPWLSNLQNPVPPPPPSASLTATSVSPVLAHLAAMTLTLPTPAGTRYDLPSQLSSLLASLPHPQHTTCGD